MYIVEFGCPECDRIWTAKERISVCPFDGAALEVEFKTVAYKPKGDANEA